MMIGSYIYYHRYFARVLGAQQEGLITGCPRMWPDVEEVIIDLLASWGCVYFLLSGESWPLLARSLRLVHLFSVIGAWLSSLGLTSDKSTRGRLDSVIFLLRWNIGFKVVLSGSSECFGILLDCRAVLLEIGFKVEALIASDAVQTFFEENFLEIFLLVSESFRVIFRYNTRPPCLCK